MKKPEVSVVLPYYEGLTWLPRSIGSVRDQEGVSWELIIVDDGSKQAPTSMVEALQDDRLRLVRIGHSGKGVALNRGVSEALAELVCFIDQDDIMNPGRLSLQHGGFLKNPCVDVVYSDYERVHDDGRVIDRFISRQASGRECLKRMARSTGLVSMQTVMIKKAVFNEIGGFSCDSRLTGLDDAEFFVRLFTAGVELCHVPGVVQKWVSHGENYSKSPEFQGTRLILLRYLSIYARTNPLIRKELPHFQYHAYLMRGLFFLENGRPAEALPELRKAVKVCPVNLNGYYLLMKSWIKKAGVCWN